MSKNLLEEISQPLLSWYDKGHRNLPWRENKSAYRIWVSEIMLQQTRVEAVKPYFLRFMEAFPDINALANANDERLLKYWEGLGYYSRVRNMKKAAAIAVEEYAGVLPDTYELLIKLPGIGSYTAGAIASIAYNEPIPAVDGNVLRIISRLRMDDEDIMLPAVKKKVEKELLPVMPKDRPGDFNQALMELGATVCIPNGQAKCGECPWNSLCKAKKHNCIADYPKKTAKKKRTIEQKTVLILKDGENVAIHKRASKGLLAGMYELPMLEGSLKENEVLERLNNMGIHALHIKMLESAVHIFSHKEWHMTGYAVRMDELMSRQDNDFLFIHPKETEEKYPIPAAFATYVKYLDIKLGNEKFLS